MKLATRVTLAVATVTAVALASSFLAVSMLVSRNELRDLDRTLLVRAQATLIRTRMILDHASAVPPDLFDDGVEELPGTATPTARFVALYSAGGRVLAASSAFEGAVPSLAEWDGSHDPPEDGLYVDLPHGSEELRAVLLPAAPDGRVLLYAVSRAYLDAEERFLNRTAALMFFAAVLVTSLLARWIGKRMARDVETIAAVAREVAQGQLDARVGNSAQGGTETRMLAADIDHMIHQLSAMMLAQRTFISHAAHELRSPLSTIRGELQLALRRERTAADYRTAIQAVLDDVEFLASLSEDLLVLARTQASKDQADAGQAVSPAEIVEGAAHLVRGAAEERGVALESPMAPEDSIRCLRGAPGALMRALRNLIENAIVHTPSGGRVRVQTQVHSDRVLLTVEDDGSGIPADDRDSVFEPFFRGSKDQAGDRPGAGLGLAIARDIVRNHDGDIHLDRGYTQGARFVIELPAHIVA